MTNFRYSQNPRVARKRPSRASRTATRRKVSDDRYRGQSEIRRSARGNKRANHKRARDPREIGLTSFEPMPYGYERWNGSVWLDSWVDQYNSELERIETRFNDGYDVTHLVNGLYNLADTFDYNAKTSHRANRRRSHTPHRASRRASRRRPHSTRHSANRSRRTARMWQEDGETLMDYEEAVAGLSLPSGSRPRIYMDYNDQILAPKSLHYLEQYLETYGEPIRYRTTSDSMDNIADWMIRPANRGANRKRAMTDYDVQVAADAIFEFHFNNSQDEFDEIYEDDTHLVYEVIERYLDETGEEYNDYDVTDIASFIAGGNSSW